MRILAKALISTSAATLFLQMAHAGELPERNGYIPAPAQHSAILDCKYELGTHGWPRIQATYVAYPWGGDSVLRIVPDHQISAQDAAWINACADKKLGRISAPADGAPVQPRRNKCTKNAPVIYGGATYCIRS